jgi:hypothetical protein
VNKFGRKVDKEYYVQVDGVTGYRDSQSRSRDWFDGSKYIPKMRSPFVHEIPDFGPRAKKKTR